MSARIVRFAALFLFALSLGATAEPSLAIGVISASPFRSIETETIGGAYGTLNLQGTVSVAGLPASASTVAAASRPALPGRSPRRLSAQQPKETHTGGYETASSAAIATVPVAPIPSSPSISGLSSLDNPFALDPPDPQLAAGPLHLVEMVNVQGRIFDKLGTALATFALDALFLVAADPNGASFDPKVIYDAGSGRFFASYTSLVDVSGAGDTGRLHIAISSTSNPLDAWNIYIIEMPEEYPDQPGLGLTDDKVTISFNRFDIDDGALPFVGVQTFVLQKSDLIAGANTSFLATAPDPAHFTVRPAHSLTSTSDQFMASVDDGFAANVHIWKITGTPNAANVLLFHVAHPIITTYENPLAAEQPSASIFLDAGDNRLLDSIWRNNRLWVSASSYCDWGAPDPFARSCLKIIELNTTTNTLVQQISYGAPFEEFYFPAIRLDSAGNLVTVFTRSSALVFAEARIAGRLATDTAGTLSPSVLLKAGEVVHNPGFQNPERWGDYMGAAVDPAFPSVIWTVGEYAKDDAGEQWGTSIGAFRHGATSTDTDADGCADAEEILNNPSAGGDRNALDFWDFFDVPVPALLPAAPGGTKSKAVAITDVLAIISYSGTSNNGPATANGADYDSDLNANGIEDGAEYDRSASVVPGELWHSGPPSGAVSIIDALVALAQVGHSCSGPP